MIAEITGGRAWVAAALLSLTVAGGALGQGRLTVSKGTGEDAAMFTTIQAAVNAAKPGQVIEILDASVYDEQVTIDGRDASPWPGVAGGKNGITIRYAPASGAGAAWNSARPKIRYRDISNTHPKTTAEAGLDNELTGASNYAACGALRVLHAKNVTIEGLAVDGSSPYAFGAAGVLGETSDLFHGNAAIALVASGGVAVRNCDIGNAYFGVYVNDKNPGGAFANQYSMGGAADVPLSGFGKTGGHVFEYNRVRGNVAGFSFESSYDFGTTARYNLIYNNKRDAALINAVPSLSATVKDLQCGGAFLFADMYLAPLAVYNNTFYDNTDVFVGKWQAGGQHLVFNNIFGKSAPANNPGSSHMSLNDKFPNRTHNNVSVADNEGTYFQSTAAENAGFLVPVWDNAWVAGNIKNKGWAAAGIRNGDGSAADVGAASSSAPARPSASARIIPTSFISVGGTSAKASFLFTVDRGAFSNAKIKMLRFIAPLPDNKDSWGSALAVVPADAVQTISAPPTSVITAGGNNSFTFPVSAVPASTEYGFVEIIAEGTDANGRNVASDVGFLPYRRLDYTLDIKFYKGAQQVTTVQAGEQVTMRVTPMNGATAYTNKLDGSEFTLLSNPGIALMWANETTPFVSAKDQTGAKDYAVFFKTAGDEIVSGAGISTAGGSTSLFFGTAELKVKPGAADHVAFLSPIPLSQLGNAPAAIINRGVDFDVKVAVQDMYGNAVDVATPVSIVSSKPDVGDAGAPGAIATKTVNTDKATGIATFIARVTNGYTGNEFDLTASISGGKTDVGRLRIGRALDRLEIYYADTTRGYDPTVEINGNVGDWFKVTVKVILNDAVNTEQTSPKAVRVTSDNNGLFFSATNGGASATEFPLNRGVAAFWVSGKTNVINACIDVAALTSVGGDLDGSISPGNRCAVSFVKPSSSIINAIVYGDGHGRPDSLLIRYTEGGAKLTDEGMKPDKATLTWPTTADGVEMTASGAALTVRGDYLLHVNLVNASLSNGSQRPAGYTSIAGLGRGLVKIYNGGAIDDGFDVFDGIGPVIARDGEAGGGSPVIIENSSPGDRPDTLLITVSEQLRDPAKLKGAALLYTKDANPINEPGASGGATLNVIDALLYNATTYQIVVAPAAGGLAEGDWIRFDPSSGVTDRAARDNIIADNKPHPANRWARLKSQEVAPSIIESWYTANPATGKVDFAYVAFDMAVDIDKWFVDGSVSFGRGDAASITASNIHTIFSLDDVNTLKIDLSAAYKSSQTFIKTSGEIQLTLSYAPGNDWTAESVPLTDKAAPVLAEGVSLKAGGVNDFGAKNQDTMIVVYSELPGDLRASNPVTITRGNASCRPSLAMLGTPAPTGSYYRVTYLVTSDLENCPEPLNPPKTGDYVRINESAGIADVYGNAQDSPDNLRQKLTVDGSGGGGNTVGTQFSMTEENNPLYRGDASKPAKIVMWFGNGDLGVSAAVALYDNRGNVVAYEEKDWREAVTWTWDGKDRKGRYVGVGTYRFKAVCEVKIGGGKKETYTVEKSIGVVPKPSGGGGRSEAASSAPPGVFTAGSNPAAKLSGGVVGFFWGGGAVSGGTLSVYDASGRLVRSIGVPGEPAGALLGRRRICEWDLTDGKGRTVAEGSYVVTGAVAAGDGGKKHRVSAVVGVSR